MLRTRSSAAPGAFTARTAERRPSRSPTDVSKHHPLFAFCVQRPTLCGEFKYTTKRQVGKEPKLRKINHLGCRIQPEKRHFRGLKHFTAIKFKCSDPLEMRVLSRPTPALSFHRPRLTTGAQTCTRAISQKTNVKEKKNKYNLFHWRPNLPVSQPRCSPAALSPRNHQHGQISGEKKKQPEIQRASPGAALSSDIPKNPHYQTNAG